MAEEPTQEEVFEYLDELQETGRTNMFGAVVYMQAKWLSMPTRVAEEYLLNWINAKEEQDGKR